MYYRFEGQIDAENGNLMIEMETGQSPIDEVKRGEVIWYTRFKAYVNDFGQFVGRWKYGNDPHSEDYDFVLFPNDNLHLKSSVNLTEESSLLSKKFKGTYNYKGQEIDLEVELNIEHNRVTGTGFDYNNSKKFDLHGFYIEHKDVIYWVSEYDTFEDSEIGFMWYRGTYNSEKGTIQG